MAHGYTVALLTAEDAAILRGIPERVRATYKAMDANDMGVVLVWQNDRGNHRRPAESAVMDMTIGFNAQA